MKCVSLRRHLGSFVDGELDPATQIEFERHLDGCPRCQEHLAFERSFRAQTKAALGGARAPDHLWSRTLDRLDEVDEERSARPSLLEVRPLKWKQTWPIAAAAAVLLVLGIVVGLPETSNYKSAGLGLLDEAVELHTRKLPSDVNVKAPQEISSYFHGKTPFPVRPARFDEPALELVGARYTFVDDRPAAALYYDDGRSRVTLLVLEDAPEMVEGAQQMEVGGRAVYYQNVGGYIVPIRRHAGLVYAFFGDLEQPALFRLAATARVAY